MLEIDGNVYVTAAEVGERLGISRQTLWRWRQEEKIPQGYRYRGHQILFSETEFADIESFANRLEPIRPTSDRDQLNRLNEGPE